MLICAALANGDGWPLVRGNVLGTGVAQTSLPDQPEMLWKYQAGKDAGFDATAVIADGIIYIGDNAGTMHAVRLADGTPVWTKTFEDSGFGAGGAFDEGRMYVGDLNGVVRCLSLENGDEQWKATLDGEVYAGPTPYGDEVLVTCEAGQLVWLNKDDGKERLRFTIDAPLRCTPTISGGRVMLAGCDSLLHVIDVASGAEISTVKIDGPTGATPAMRGDRVYFGTEGGTFFAIDVPIAKDKEPSVAWTFRDERRGQPIRSAAAVIEGLIVYGAQGKAIYGLDPASGRKKWDPLPTRSRVESSPVISGDKAVAATTDGKLYVLDVTTGNLNWEYDAGGSFTASPAVVDGQIILGNTDGTLYCFGSRQTNKPATEVTENTEGKADD